MGVIMGLKSKFLLLVIVYIAGFLSAIYYVAPADENSRANDKAGRIVQVINHYKQKTSERMSQIDKDDLANVYDKGLAAINDLKQKYAAAHTAKDRRSTSESQEEMYQ